MFTALVSTRRPFRPRNARATCVVAAPLVSLMLSSTPISVAAGRSDQLFLTLKPILTFRERGIETERRIGSASQHGTPVCAMHQALPLQPREVAANAGRMTSETPSELFNGRLPLVKEKVQDFLRALLSFFEPWRYSTNPHSIVFR